MRCCESVLETRISTNVFFPSLTVTNEDDSGYVPTFFLLMKIPPWRVCVRAPLFRRFINGNCCATPAACRGSPAPTRRKLARQSEDALGNKLKHYLWGWQVPWQWTMTSPKLRPLTIYLQQCGTSHIRAVRPGVFLHLRPPAANYMIWCLRPRQVRSPDSERARRYLQNNNSCCCPWAKCSTGSWLVAALQRKKQKELVQCAEKLGVGILDIQAVAFNWQ